MKVLVVGGGGREHAMIWRLAQNPTVDRLYAAPGNAGIEQEATCLPLGADDIPGIVAAVDREAIDLTIVGPEAPLVGGLADELEARGHPVFGPTREAARIEGSKSWAKELCERHGIPAARSRTFTETAPALDYVEELGGAPVVIKADGLAAGKGVVIAEDREEASAAVRACLVDHAFGDAGARVLVEEFLRGPEISAFALTDGRDVLPLCLAQDCKRAGEGDTGPNTGGMGAYSPLAFVDPQIEGAIWSGIVRATVRAMEIEGVRYRGLLYAGLMLTDEGPKVLEYNCRFGDPETQAILPRMRSDLGELVLACVEGNIGNYKALWTDEACVTVVAASGGYPGEYDTGAVIDGLADAARVEGAQIFHAGTAERNGRVVTDGGRVLAASGLGPTLADARARAYEALQLISFDGMQFRTDIAAGAAGEE
jgi:phosphoribosylamine---glycine ligase